MRFIGLAYEEEEKLNVLSQSEWTALRAETLAYVEELRKSGHYITSAALESIETARTVRIRKGKLSTTDGPFAETREQLGGIFLFEAHDLDEATRIAAKWPSARIGSIEVRPIVEQLRPGSRYGRA